MGIILKERYLYTFQFADNQTVIANREDREANRVHNKKINLIIISKNNFYYKIEVSSQEKNVYNFY